MYQPSAPTVEEETELVLLRVEIPQGTGGGGQLNVEVSGGEQIAITVPWGLTPGQPLELWYDPAAQTLAMHSMQDWQALSQPRRAISCNFEIGRQRDKLY